MTIEIHQPELEALIHERMNSGAFQGVEDMLLQTFQAAAKMRPAGQDVSRRTGADLIAAMQACPYPDFFF